MLTLIPHPAQPPRGVEAVTVVVAMGEDGWRLDYRVSARAALVWPAVAAPERADGLWQSTCFEMFVKSANGAAYREFNFASSTRWAAYQFDGYREGMAPLVMPAPRIAPGASTMSVALDYTALPAGPLRANLTAVIDEADGTKSYWALAHPAGPPDFHDPACFVLELPAAAKNDMD